MGTKYAYWILLLSATKPITGGIKAPPTIAMITNDEPIFVKDPKPRILNENIVGNMIDIKNATPINAKTGNL